MRDATRAVVVAALLFGACDGDGADAGLGVDGSAFEGADGAAGDAGGGEATGGESGGGKPAADAQGSVSDSQAGSAGGGAGDAPTGAGGDSTGDPAADAGTASSGAGGTDTGPGGTSDGGASGGTADAGATADLPHFSFFVTSYESIQELSGSVNGFGGDLRFGESGPGAGLRGADAMCAVIAEMSMPGAAAKQWRAFLSVTADESGAQVDAIDRVGEGPWYDRVGRLVALTKADLISERPKGADAAILNDLPNEWGVPNHQPDPTKPKVDNHDTLTGSNAQGRLFSATATCKDWTTSDGSTANGKPRVGHTWPTQTGGGGPGGGPGGGKPGGGGGPSGGDGSMAHWISALNEAGCGAGVNLIESGGPPPGSTTVGAGGGYGGFYCFALMP